jgi:hypothetical protein
MITPQKNNDTVVVVDPEGNDHTLNLTEYTILRSEILRRKELGWAVWIENGLFSIDQDGKHYFDEKCFSKYDEALMYLAFGDLII